MTKREFMNAIATKSTITDEMVAMALTELANLDKKNASAKAHRIEKASADKPLMEAIATYLGEHAKGLGSEIGVACGISTPKAIALAKKMVASGELVETEVSIPKVGKRKVYSLAKSE